MLIGTTLSSLEIIISTLVIVLFSHMYFSVFRNLRVFETSVSFIYLSFISSLLFLVLSISVLQLYLQRCLFFVVCLVCFILQTCYFYLLQLLYHVHRSLSLLSLNNSVTVLVSTSHSVTATVTVFLSAAVAAMSTVTLSLYLSSCSRWFLFVLLCILFHFVDAVLLSLLSLNY